MAKANSITEKELIQQQLDQAKDTLNRLRELSHVPKQSDNSNEKGGNAREREISREFPNNEFSAGGNRGTGTRNSASPRAGHRPRNISTTARDNLVQALGFQVSKLEDDLKVSLLSYFEQVEKQKEDLIESFNIMQQQLQRHQDVCQQQSKEMAEKEQALKDLESSKLDLELEVERIRNENHFAQRSPYGLNSSAESFPELIFSPSPGVEELQNGSSGFCDEKPDLSEKLLQENARLRELLKKHDDNDYGRLERKVELQQKLCKSYDKDISSKDRLIKRLQAENRGLQSDVQSMQDEILRVNASRLNAEQDKSKVQQELQFDEEQIFVLREKLARVSDENEFLSKTISNANTKVESRDGDLSRSRDEIAQLERKCTAYQDKLNDKEKNIVAMKKDGQEKEKTMEAMKKELSFARSEAQRLRREYERLQRENADREIDRLRTEGFTKASNSKINQLKEQVAGSNQEVEELRRKCDDLEKREAELSREVFGNLEKYTQAEQELYLTKKELAQQRGYNDSAEKRRNDAERGLENAKERLESLEREVRGSTENRRDEREAKIQSLQRENEQLNDEKNMLQERIQDKTGELADLERELAGSREQSSIQRMRLEGSDALMQRKDAKIQELQEELVEIHHQNDALTDELLKKNRDLENFKMAKKLAEQELELIKTGVLPGRHSSASRDRDGSLFVYIEPATPDSGFAEVDAQLKGKDREKAIEQLRKEMLKSHGKFARKPQQGEESSSKGTDGVKDEETKLKAVLEEELSDVVNENDALKNENTHLKSKLVEIQTRFSELQDMNRDLKERESELKEIIKEKDERENQNGSETEEKLSEFEKENRNLREKEKELREALERAEALVPVQAVRPEETQMDVLESLEADPGMDLMNFGTPEKDLRQTVTENVMRQDMLQVESGVDGGLIDFDDTPKLKDIKELQRDNISLVDEKTALLEKVEELEQGIGDVEAWANVLKEENDLLKDENKELDDRMQRLKDLCDGKDREKEKELGVIKKENKSLTKANQETAIELEQYKEKLKSRERENELKANSLKDLESSLDEKNEKLKVRVKELMNETGIWEEKVKESHMEKLKLEGELQEMRHRLDEEKKTWQAKERENEDLQKRFNNEAAAKDLKMLELQKKWEQMNRECNELKSEMRKAKEESAQQQEEILRAQAELTDLERKVNKNNKRQRHVEEQLKQAEESECALLTELGETKTKLRRLEKEVNNLKQDAALAEDSSKEKQKANKSLEQRIIAVNEEKENAEKVIGALGNEKAELNQQVKRVQNELAKLKDKYEELEDEKEQMEMSMNDIIREKSRDIRDLEADLEMSEQKFEELKRSWNNTELVTTDLQGELLKAKEEAIEAQNECERLVRLKDDLEEEINEKERQLDGCKFLEEDLRNGINEREKELEILRCNIEEEETKMRALKDENEELNDAVELALKRQKEMEHALQMAQEAKDQLEREKQAAHESIADLEAAFERSEDENLNVISKLSQAEKQISILQQKSEMARKEIEEVEQAHAAAESKAKERERELNKHKEDESLLKSKLEMAESKIAALEKDTRSKWEKEQSLQEDLHEALENVKDLEENEKESKARQRALENKLVEVKRYNEQLETEREELEYKVKEMKKKLKSERERVEELEDELTSKKFEKNVFKQEVEMLNATLSETDAQQSMGINERDKLKRDLFEASNKVLELETTCESHHENIEELEKLLDQKRAKVVDLEDGLKESTEKIADLQTQAEELNRTMRAMKEDNTNLEKMLEKQKQLSTGYKNSLSQRDTEIAKLSEKRDSAETALQFMKKDLARRDGVYKAHEDELAETEKQLANTAKKLQEIKASHEGVLQENEKLKREVEATKRRIAELEGLQKEGVVMVSEVDALNASPGVAGPLSADTKIKSLDVKLTHAQNKVTDLETELAKEIRRHELDCIKTRPNLPYLGKRSSYYDNEETSSGYNKYGSQRDSSSEWDRNSSFDDFSDTGSSYSGQGTPSGSKARSRTPKKGAQREGQDLDRAGDSKGHLTNVTVQGGMDTPPLLLGHTKSFQDFNTGDYGSGNESERSAISANQKMLLGNRNESARSMEAVNKAKSSHSDFEAVEFSSRNEAGRDIQKAILRDSASVKPVIYDKRQSMKSNDANRKSEQLFQEPFSIELANNDFQEAATAQNEMNTSEESTTDGAQNEWNEATVGQMNDLIAKMNENEVDPFLEEYLMNQKPAGISSPFESHAGVDDERLQLIDDPSSEVPPNIDIQTKERETTEESTDPFITPFDIPQGEILSLNDSYDMIHPAYTVNTESTPYAGEDPFSVSSTPHNNQVDPFSEQFVTNFDTTPGHDEEEALILTPPADDLLNFGPADAANTTSSSITNVTSISEVDESQDQLLLNMDQFDGFNKGEANSDLSLLGDFNSGVNKTSENPINSGNIAADVFVDDVTDPFSEAFTAPRRQAGNEIENRIGISQGISGELAEQEDDDMNGEPVVILINDEVYEHEEENDDDPDLEEREEKSGTDFDFESVNIDVINERKENLEDLKEEKPENKDSEAKKSTRPKTVRFDFAATENEEREDLKNTFDDNTAEVDDEKDNSDEGKIRPQGIYVQVLPNVKDFGESLRESKKKEKTADKTKGFSVRGQYGSENKESERVRRFDFTAEKDQEELKGEKQGTSSQDVEEEVEVSRKPSDIIRRFEGNTQSREQDVKWKPRPRTTVNRNELQKNTGSPETKPRTNRTQGITIGTSAQAQGATTARGNHGDQDEEQSPEEENIHGSEEDRSVALGRERVMRLIAAFEGKEV